MTNGTLNADCVGEYSGVTRTLHMEKCGQMVWAKLRPPRDRTITKIEQAVINSTLFTIVVTLACFGIALALFFLAINIKFRHER